MTQTIIAHNPDIHDEFCLGIVVRAINDDDEIDVCAALKAAAAEFLHTPDGDAAVARNAGNYNWGDLVDSIPADFCARHGVEIVDTFTTNLVVPHDESLIPDDL